jgi:putative sterol carrier protein
LKLLQPTTDLGQESWYIDLKDEGKVGKGEKDADVRLVMKDEIFQQLADGKANAQYNSLFDGLISNRSLFMQGKYKVSTPFKSAITDSHFRLEA